MNESRLPFSTAATPSATLVLLYLSNESERGSEGSASEDPKRRYSLLHVVVHVLKVLVYGRVRVAVGYRAELERGLVRVRMHQAAVVESTELMELLSANGRERIKLRADYSRGE